MDRLGLELSAAFGESAAAAGGARHAELSGPRDSRRADSPVTSPADKGTAIKRPALLNARNV